MLIKASVDDTNLILEAVKFSNKKQGFVASVLKFLFKNIPSGAGYGGSSNAGNHIRMFE